MLCLLDEVACRCRRLEVNPVYSDCRASGADVESCTRNILEMKIASVNLVTLVTDAEQRWYVVWKTTIAGPAEVVPIDSPCFIVAVYDCVCRVVD